MTIAIFFRIHLSQALADGIDFSLRLLDGRVFRKPSNRVLKVNAALISGFGIADAEGHEDLSLSAGKLKLGQHHANHRVVLAGEIDGAAHHSGIGPHALHPEAMA